MQLQTERFRDFPTEPIRELVKDGAWIVPPDERPIGWKPMGLLDPWKELPNALVELPEEEQTEPVNSGRWDAIIRDLTASPDGRLVMDRPASGASLARFKNNLRSILAMRKETFLQKWSIRDFNGRLLVERVSDREPAEVLVKETTTTTERSTSVERSVSMQVPVPPESKSAILLKRFREREEDGDLARRLVDATLKAYGRSLTSDVESEDQWDVIERAATTLQSRREANAQAAGMFDYLEMASPGIQGRCTEKDLDAIFEALLILAGEKREREHWLTYYALECRKKGDPCRADRIEELLEPEDIADIEREFEAEQSRKNERKTA